MMRMGAAVAAVTMRKRQVQDLSMELAGQGEVTREGLEGMMQANSADGNIPVLQMQRLTQSKRVLKFLQTDAVTISVSSLEQECAVKHERICVQVFHPTFEASLPSLASLLQTACIP